MRPGSAEDLLVLNAKTSEGSEERTATQFELASYFCMRNASQSDARQSCGPGKSGAAWDESESEYDESNSTGI